MVQSLVIFCGGEWKATDNARMLSRRLRQVYYKCRCSHITQPCETAATFLLDGGWFQPLRRGWIEEEEEENVASAELFVILDQKRESVILHHLTRSGCVAGCRGACLRTCPKFSMDMPTCCILSHLCFAPPASSNNRQRFFHKKQCCSCMQENRTIEPPRVEQRVKSERSKHGIRSSNQ